MALRAAFKAASAGRFVRRRWEESMMKRSSKLITLVVLAAGLVQLLASDALAVMFPDKALEAALRALVFDKKNTVTELSEDDLGKIFVLDAKGKGIRDLSGIEKCINIELIDLANNEVANIEP